MRTVLIIARAELLLLSRDLAGLLVLFLMPAVLVVLITLVQKNIMDLTGQNSTRVILLDMDRGWFAAEFLKKLRASGLEVTLATDLERDERGVRDMVNAGQYQAGLVVTPGCSRALESLQPVGAEPPEVRIVYDPALSAGLRTGIRSLTRLLVGTIAGRLKSQALVQALGNAPEPVRALAMNSSPPIAVREQPDRQGPRYDPVQQNVPAWALFGVFFIVVPLAGAMIEERRNGIWLRLRTCPVAPQQIVCAKILAGVSVCMVQFAVVAIIGMSLFPLLGLPRFSLGHAPGMTILIALAAALAACALGLLLGVCCTTFEQASAVGATMVVASAALGGVMVPVYAMPAALRDLAVISPVNWALTAFHDLLLRGAPAKAALPEVAALVLFACAVLVAAWGGTRR